VKKGMGRGTFLRLLEVKRRFMPKAIKLHKNSLIPGRGSLHPLRQKVAVEKV